MRYSRVRKRSSLVKRTSTRSAQDLIAAQAKICMRRGHLMPFQDRSLKCSDCGSTFTFSVKEQEQFAEKGYTNVPGRCPACRQVRKAKKEAAENANIRSTSNYGNTYDTGRSNRSGYRDTNFRLSPNKQMYPAKCATCGKDTQVPFQPRNDRPVYCSDCFRKIHPVQR